MRFSHLLKPARFSRRHALLFAAALATLGLTACSALGTFDQLVPKDGGVTRVVRDAAFGPGPRQKLDVYRPTTPDRKLPIIVFLYGGSWNSGSKNGYSWVGRALAARGFVTVIPDYRYAREAAYPGFLEDGAAATRMIIGIAESLGADPDRIILAGHSAGAYNAAMLAYDERWLGADRVRVRGFIGLAGPYDFLPFDSPISRQVFGSERDLPATQPVNFVDARDPPALIASAIGDRTVKESNSNSLTAKLRARGVKVTRKRYPGVGHVGILTAIAKPLRGRASVLEDMSVFAREAAGPAAPQSSEASSE